MEWSEKTNCRPELTVDEDEELLTFRTAIENDLFMDDPEVEGPIIPPIALPLPVLP